MLASLKHQCPPRPQDTPIQTPPYTAGASRQQSTSRAPVLAVFIPLAMQTSPAAMAVRARRLANSCEDRGDQAGMFRNLDRVSTFMALPGYSYDEFVALGGLD